MIVNKAQVYLPWIAVGLCILVSIAYLIARPPEESFDQCMARRAHSGQNETDLAANAEACAGHPRKSKRVIGE